MSSQQVDSRSELAKWISGTHVFPAGREELLERARSEAAPDTVLSAIQSLPPDRVFENMADLSRELGLDGIQHD
ncbi:MULTISPECIES: DUF2795 domain-containing protein [unclassified Nonomuraea]|uniref:DUF2795 domain-containing protein n=1 Tax=Nonomuraea sp. NPDC003804 TaxID=3154547 RepID=UPI0033B244CF